MINIGLLIICTGKYDIFLPELLKSADQYFLPNDNVNYYLFTDKCDELKSTQTNRSMTLLPIDHKPFPYATLDRYKHFHNWSHIFTNEQFLYYVDVDCRFVGEVGREILDILVAVQHCGFYNKKPGTYELNPKSCLYTDPKRYTEYMGGGFQGGVTEHYLKAVQWCKDKIELDGINGIIPTHNDETAWNRYLLDNQPTKILNPSYHFPETKALQPNVSMFQPKILLLDKDHNQIRY